jgi:hypothetical protein
MILDQVTDEEGSILIRLPIGWVGLNPGNNNQILACIDGIPQWIDNPAGGIGGAGAALASPYLSDPNRYAGFVTFASGSATTQVLIANRIYYCPVAMPIDRTLSALAFRVSSPVALSSARLAIFQNDHPGGGPGTLLADGGTVATTSTGLKTVPINLPLNPGLYWLALWVSHAITVSALAATWTVGGNGWDMSLATPTTATVLTRNQAFGTPFANENLQTHTVGGVANAPLVVMR